MSCVVASRADRRRERRVRAQAESGADAEAVLDVLELTEFAWHDCYGEAVPPTESSMTSSSSHPGASPAL